MRTTKKNEVELLKQARTALDLPAGAQVYPALTHLMHAVHDYLGGGQLSHYRGNSWGITWIGPDASDNFVAFPADVLALSADDFIDYTLTSNGIKSLPSPNSRFTQAFTDTCVEYDRMLQDGPAMHPFKGGPLDDQIGNAAMALRGGDFLRLALRGQHPNVGLVKTQLHYTDASLRDTMVNLVARAVMYDRPQVGGFENARKAVLDLTGADKPDAGPLSEAVVQKMLGSQTRMATRWSDIAEGLGMATQAIYKDHQLSGEDVTSFLAQVGGAHDDNDLACAMSSFSRRLQSAFVTQGHHADLIYALGKAGCIIMGGALEMDQSSYLDDVRQEWEKKQSHSPAPGL